MNYNEMKDNQKLEVYIPAMNNFYSMTVTDCGEGIFTVSNYGCRKSKKIGGHEVSYLIQDQNDVDKFFYMHKGSIKQTDLERITKEAEEHAQKNKRTWIFNN